MKSEDPGTAQGTVAARDSRTEAAAVQGETIVSGKEVTGEILVNGGAGVMVQRNWQRRNGGALGNGGAGEC
jgi:hypothetical protein